MLVGVQSHFHVRLNWGCDKKVGWNFIFLDIKVSSGRIKSMKCYNVELARVLGVAVSRYLVVDWQQRKWTANFTIMFHIFPIFHAPSRPFLIEGVLGSKNPFC